MRWTTKLVVDGGIVVLCLKEVILSKGCLTLPAISSQWETLATNLDEFRKVGVRLNFLFVLD
jgi:hypothetical protein